VGDFFYEPKVLCYILVSILVTPYFTVTTVSFIIDR